MNKIFFGLAFCFISLIFIGCSIGANQTDCEKNGCNYKNAGLCQDTFTIMTTNPEEITKRAYKDIKCKDK